MAIDRPRAGRFQRLATQSGPIAAAFMLVLAASAPVRAEEATATAAPIAIEPIAFKPGASSAVVSGSVVSPDRKIYSIGARAQQTLTVAVASQEDNAVFQIYQPPAKPERRDYGIEVVGQALEGAAEGKDAKHWSGRLPVTGEYLVVVGPTRGNADYRLTVAIH
jgi:hypothetical protein